MFAQLLDSKRVKFGAQNAAQNADQKVQAGLGNTIIRPARVENARSRNWCFTLNNYTPEDIKIITNLDCKYVFQEEKGESGTPHLQGLLCFRNAKTLGGVKKILPRAHFEITKNLQASILYCSKEDTRCGDIWSTIPLPSMERTGVAVHTDTFTQRLNRHKPTYEEFCRDLGDISEFIREGPTYEN